MPGVTELLGRKGTREVSISMEVIGEAMALYSRTAAVESPIVK